MMNASHGNLTLPTILCCVCGVSIESNPTSMCSSCLHERVDVTADINKKCTIHSCRSCNRFLGPPWQEVELESKELMVMCLRKINGLSKVKVVDAAWIWTEPHSMRLKIKLTVQKEVMHGAFLQQATVCEFVIRNQQCKHCEASYATGAWHALVQVRQRVTHKRTFFYLEQLMLKHEAHKECVNIVTFKDGIDFYFKERNQALRFMSFLETVVPMKHKYSRKLISADKQDNSAEFKHNYLVEIAPICKDDLVVLPKDLAAKQSNISPLVLVKRIGASIFFIDPLSGEKTDINSEKYFRYNFKSLLTSRELVRYYVLSVEAVLADHRPGARMKRVATTTTNEEDQTRTRTKQSIAHASKLAECVVVRERDFGRNDTQFHCITHLGPLLAPGDFVLGFDLTSTNLNVDEADKKTLARIANLPDVILVRKCYDKKDRKWMLKNFEDEVAVEGGDSRKDKDKMELEKDREVFLQQVEGDRDMRQFINVYKKKNAKKNVKPAVAPAASKMQEEGEDMDGDDEDEDLDDEEVRLEELLDDMSLNSDLDEELPEEERGAKVLSPEEAAQSGAIAVQPQTSGTFDASKFSGATFSFV